MFCFETLIYGCLMFIVSLHCCQNLTLPNVRTRHLLPGNPTTAALVAFVILFRPIDPISQNIQQWLLGARNWITVIIERSDHSLVTYWGLNFCWWLFTTFWYVISKKVKSHVFWYLKKTKNTYSRALGVGENSRSKWTGNSAKFPSSDQLFKRLETGPLLTTAVDVLFAGCRRCSRLTGFVPR